MIVARPSSSDPAIGRGPAGSCRAGRSCRRARALHGQSVSRAPGGPGARVLSFVDPHGSPRSPAVAARLLRGARRARPRPAARIRCRTRPAAVPCRRNGFAGIQVGGREAGDSVFGPVARRWRASTSCRHAGSARRCRCSRGRAVTRKTAVQQRRTLERGGRCRCARISQQRRATRAAGLPAASSAMDVRFVCWCRWENAIDCGRGHPDPSRGGGQDSLSTHRQAVGPRTSGTSTNAAAEQCSGQGPLGVQRRGHRVRHTGTAAPARTPPRTRPQPSSSAAPNVQSWQPRHVAGLRWTRCRSTSNRRPRCAPNCGTASARRSRPGSRARSGSRRP